MDRFKFINANNICKNKPLLIKLCFFWSFHTKAIFAFAKNRKLLVNINKDVF